MNIIFFDKLSESERENEKDKADIIAQKKRLNELDTTEVFREFWLEKLTKTNFNYF